MKTIRIISLSIILGTIAWSCKDLREASISPKATINTPLNNRSLRPVGLDSLSDLIVTAFTINGTIVQIGADFKIPIKVIEKNIGTKVASHDTLYVYQPMPIGFGTYVNRKAGYLIRYISLNPSASQTLTGNIFIHKSYIPATTRKINLWVKADGGNQITELSESNNYSDTLWGVYMPI